MGFLACEHNVQMSGVTQRPVLEKKFTLGALSCTVTTMYGLMPCANICQRMGAYVTPCNGDAMHIMGYMHITFCVFVEHAQHAHVT